MRTVVAGWLGLVVVGLTAGGAVAQPERYELGQRLKRFEQAWEEQKDPTARKKALAIVKKASGQFLSLQLGEAGRTLDDARWALQGKTLSDTERWLESLYAVPERRALDYKAKVVSVEIRQFYPVANRPAGATATVRFEYTDAATAAPLDKLPARASLPIPKLSPGERIRPGPQADVSGFPHSFDTAIMAEFTAGGILVAPSPVAVCVFHDLAPRLNWRRFAAADIAKYGRTLEIATEQDLSEQLERAAAGEVPETDFRFMSVPASNAQPPGKYFDPSHPGDHHIAVPTGKEQVTSCRLLVPKGLATDKPIPLVVALHGAGGSENLFFEGYGNGHIVKECQKRGWMLLAPRSGLIGAAPVAAIIDKLAERYPIDPKRIFLVGHSMGAGQAIELAQQHPGKFAAVASLGGAGRVRKKEAFADLPVFVGVGDQDFALKGSRALHKALTDAGAKRVTYKEYPDLEHLVIVREALPDVFAAWDEIAKK
ncbi:MAG: alpha/beta fold hydrolase [Gemmataceae bacterium]